MSKGTSGDAKCVTEIFGESKNKDVCFGENNGIKLIKQSNKCVDIYVQNDLKLIYKQSLISQFSRW